MSLPHFDDQGNLEPPPSFQQALPRAHDGRRRAVPGVDKHGRGISRISEAGKIVVTTITSSSTAKSRTTITSSSTTNPRTTATLHTDSVHQKHSCKNDSYHTLHAPSSSKLTLLFGKPSSIPAPSQSGHPLSTAKTSTSAIDAGAAPRSKFFDPWNSSSTGHQRAENILSGSTSWRESRNAKLGKQFRGGLSGGAQRVADTVGAGSEGFGKDGRKENGGWEKGASGLRTAGQRSLAEVWGASKGAKGMHNKVAYVEEPYDVRASYDANRETSALQKLTHATNADLPLEAFSIPLAPQGVMEKQIFAGLCFYINGSTAPLVSDLKLKQVLTERGGKISIGLGRRTVTHVILGTANGYGGAGGGLAATKIQREIARVGGKGLRFVGVEWVLSSIRLNARQPESHFSSLKLAAKGQHSVYGMLQRSSSSISTKTDELEGRASNG